MRMRWVTPSRCGGIRSQRDVEGEGKATRLDGTKNFSTRASFGNAKTKKEIDARIAREIPATWNCENLAVFLRRKLAGPGSDCEGCHTVTRTERPREEVMPPRSSVKPEWPEEVL